MPSIDGIELFSLSGLAEPVGLQVEEITRAGVSGHAYREIAFRGDAFQMIAKVDCDTIAEAKSLYNDDLKACQGITVTIIDDYGTTYEDVMVEQVKLLSLLPLKGAVGGVSSQKGAFLIVGLTLRCTVL